ncbi:MAG: hypothetical protein J6Y85_02365 [Alphaproteobacteria bacterium]|nr:hypothetical protein [Alphaproteobacteria bacterium]
MQKNSQSLTLRCCNNGTYINAEKQLMIKRHKNGTISYIGEYVRLTDYHDSIEDTRTGPRMHRVGPQIEFDEKGKVRYIEVYGQPQSHSAIMDLDQCIWDTPLEWLKAFYVNGKVKQSLGAQKKFAPPLTMIAILKQEKLWGAVQKAIDAKKTVATRSNPRESR